MININASIVEQKVNGIIDNYDHLLPDRNTERKRSSAFILLCMSAALDLSIEEAAELLTDGGNDIGIDGLHIGDEEDGEFTITIFQGKYKNNLTGDAGFPENSVKQMIQTVAALFDPSKPLDHVNDKIAPKMEEIRSLVSRDGLIPIVRVILCNNGLKWNQIAQSWIDQEKFGDQVTWSYFNHDNIIAFSQRKKSVDDSILLHGKAIIEDFNFRRVLIGKVDVKEIASLFNKYDDQLLERNIRRYLGLHANRVNDAIRNTIIDPAKRSNFYFFNNGITMICRKFRYNNLQSENYKVIIEGMQIINGEQTCKTIQQTLQAALADDLLQGVYVLLRLYELDGDDQEFVHEITYATNSQNPVDLRDLRSNDTFQQQLEMGIKELGYSYKRVRGVDDLRGSSTVSPSIIAEAVFAIWRGKPHQAKFRHKELFGKFYTEIFSDLNAAQAILAVYIFRFVENERKTIEVISEQKKKMREADDSKYEEQVHFYVLLSALRPKHLVVDGEKRLPEFILYASHYVAMLIGRLLLANKNITINEVSHRNFKELIEFFESKKTEYYYQAINQIQQALEELYGDRSISLQQSSATFRRGDLLEILIKRNADF